MATPYAYSPPDFSFLLRYETETERLRRERDEARSLAESWQRSAIEQQTRADANARTIIAQSNKVAQLEADLAETEGDLAATRIESGKLKERAEAAENVVSIKMDEAEQEFGSVRKQIEDARERSKQVREILNISPDADIVAAVRDSAERVKRCRENGTRLREILGVPSWSGIDAVLEAVRHLKHPARPWRHGNPFTAPQGWRFLEAGEKSKNGDRWFHPTCGGIYGASPVDYVVRGKREWELGQVIRPVATAPIELKPGTEIEAFGARCVVTQISTGFDFDASVHIKAERTRY